MCLSAHVCMCVYVRERVLPRAAWGRVEKLMEILTGVRKIEKWEMRLCARAHTHTHRAQREGLTFLHLERALELGNKTG